MNFYKKRKPFISLVCAIALILSIISVPAAAADTISVTATTGATVKQGNSGYCYVSIDSTEGLAALDVTVHYDPAKVKITGVYNSVSCTLYDSVTNTDNIQFSYILDGQGTAEKTGLFYFQYQVLSNAEVGDAYFDITVGEAYDNSLNDVAVYGSRCNFKIAEKTASKSCYIYGSGSMSTAIEQEFTLSYQFSTYQIASGTAVISYDSELFEVLEVTNGAFLTDKLVDINTDLAGEIYISFVGTEYYSNKNLVSVTFRTIKNVTETSKIVFKATELIDKELNAYSCSGYTTNISVAYDETHTGDSPSMRLNGTFSYEATQITLTVSLEENSYLGAGDFVINFDPTLVTYNSCTKGFTPSYFYIDDKKVDSGELKFHIISLSDIVTEETVLTVVFDVNRPYNCETADFTLQGTELTDSMTEGILLNFIDDSVWLEYQVNFRNQDGTLLQSGMYHYGDTVQEPEAPTKESDVYGTYTFNGWDRQVTACTADATYTATYTLEYMDYTVTFRDWDGTEISKDTYHYGDAVSVPDDPQRAADDIYTYSFAGWDKEISASCTGDVVYTATYTSTYNDYTIKFLDEDGSTISSKIYHWGDEVIIPADPNKAADNTYTYAFAGWDKTVVNCAGNATYTATYTPIYIDYTVIFKNYDGAVLSSKTYHYGDKVTVPANPTKAADNTYTYAFAGWDNEIAANCTGNATYTATYTPTYINYTVVFQDWDGTELSKGTYRYGDTIIAPTDPTRAADNTYSYVFTDWDTELTCIGDMVITAEYEPTYIEYTVVFKDWDGTEISKDTYHYGDAVSVPNDPQRADEDICSFTFAGWDKEVAATCNGNVVYTAVYDVHYFGFLVSGTVTSFGVSDGEVTIKLMQNGVEVVSVVSTDGVYSLLAPEPGNYSLVVSKLNHATRNYEITVEREDISLDLMIHLKGDINGDGRVNVSDVGKANAHAKKTKFLNGYEFECADINGDGTINISDVGKMNAHAKKTVLLW